MEHFRNRNNEMYMSTWYDNYLMEYVNIVSKPKFSHGKRMKYTDILLSWYQNWGGYMEEMK